MPKITEDNLIKIIKETSGMDVNYLGRFVDRKGKREEPKRMAFLNIANNKLVGLLESRLKDLIK